MMATDTASSVPLEALPEELHPSVEHLVTEDDTPVDSIFSEKQMRLLTEPLHSSWPGPEGRRSYVAMSNVGLFFDVHRPPLVPDVLLSLDVELPADLWPKSHRSYFVWEYGKPPDVVVEVVSNREGGEDTAKLAAYARIAVRYYVIYDPHKFLGPEVLRVYRLEAREFHAMREPIWFPDVGLGLRVWPGRYENNDNSWLRWVDAEGTPIPTGRESSEVERERANRERERAERLAEQLRELGVDPQDL